MPTMHLRVDGTVYCDDRDTKPFLSPDTEVYVNVYSVDRCYGGSEEGGWYYDWYAVERTIPCVLSDAKEIRRRMMEEYVNEGPDRVSVIGDTDYVVYIEREACESETKKRPYYC